MRKLKIWKKGIALTNYIYDQTKIFPEEEKFGLTSQIRRCAISIPSNISEGYGRSSNKEFLYFLNITRGSLCELETQIQISYDQNFLSEDNYNIINTRISELHKMLKSFTEKLK